MLKKGGYNYERFKVDLDLSDLMKQLQVLSS